MDMGVGVVFVLLYLGIGLVAFLGWLVPLIVGIISIRRHRQNAVGYVLSGIGALWAVGAATALLLAFSYVRGHQQGTSPSDFTPQTFQGKTFSLKVGDLGDGYLDGYDRGRRYRFKAANGAVMVPADTRLDTCVITRQADKVRWEARTSLSGLLARDVAGPQQQVLVGPPFTVQITTARMPRQTSGNVYLRLETKDRGGHLTTISSTPRAQPPSFEARDSKGNLVWSGRFSYG
ncbi:MAG: hypothetical protein ABFD96_21680 [Armatimonadia bacterium]